jgi:hypothetical protein
VGLVFLDAQCLGRDDGYLLPLSGATPILSERRSRQTLESRRPCKATIVEFVTVGFGCMAPRQPGLIKSSGQRSGERFNSICLNKGTAVSSSNAGRPSTAAKEQRTRRVEVRLPRNVPWHSAFNTRALAFDDGRRFRHMWLAAPARATVGSRTHLRSLSRVIGRSRTRFPVA